MSFMVWNPELETGIELIGQQHRGLVEMLNRAAPACGLGWANASTPCRN
jgi:hemerythrin